jgi:hypothetical protein
MEAHRRLHSAESGQLVPRTRPRSEDNAWAKENYCICEEKDSSDRAVSWPSADKLRLLSAQSQKPTTKTAPAVEPQHAVVESTSQGKVCPSAWSSRTQDLVDGQLSRHVSIAGSLVSPPSLCSETTISSFTTAEATPPPDKRASSHIDDELELASLPSAYQKSTSTNRKWLDYSAAQGYQQSDTLERPAQQQRPSSRRSSISSSSKRAGKFTLMHRIF